MSIQKYNSFPQDRVRICKEDICVEARGKNAELIAGAFAFMLVCIAIVAVSKIR